MKCLVTITILAVVVAGWSPADAESIYSLILKGDLGEARDSLSQIATASTRNGDVLFYQSLLEDDADQSARLMQSALNASVTARYQEEIYYRLAQYHLLKANRRDLVEILADYNSRWETGKYHAEMLRLSALLDETNGDFESALSQCDRYLVSYTSRDEQQWGQVDKARIMQSNKKGIGSSQTLRRLSRAKSGAGIPLALYLLGVEATKNRRTDDAVFYYNLLREGYPAAIGLDDLVDRLSGLSVSSSEDNTAERLTGTYYTVKVGVFSESSNASRFADDLKRYDRKVEIRKRTISDREYRVVYVGRFQDYEKAAAFKLQLETDFCETFQVVTL